MMSYNVLKMPAMAAVLALALTTTAHAQKWTGFSVGVGAGAGAINHDLTIGPGPYLPANSFAFGFDGIGGEGFLGTVGVAADMQVASRYVIGVFADYDFANLETDLNLSIPSFGNLAVDGSIKLKNQFTIGGRFGFLASPDTLWYGLIGYTRADVSDFNIGISGPTTGSISLGVPKFAGITTGAGVETMLNPNWSLKAEYRYTQLRAEDISLPYGLSDYVHAELEPSIHTGRISVNYKFNWDRGASHEPMK